MSCGNDSENNGGRRFTKKRIAVLSTMSAGAAGAAYLSVTVNPAFGASIPTILAFAACPAMCAAMGGTMWLSRRFSKKNRSVQMKQKAKEASNSESIVDEQQEKLAIVVAETNDEKTVSYERPLERRKKRKTNPEGQESTSS